MNLTPEQLQDIANAAIAGTCALEQMTPGLRVLIEIHKHIEDGEIPMIPQLTTVAGVARAAKAFAESVRNALAEGDAVKNGGVH